MGKEMQWTLGLIAIAIGMMRATAIAGDVRLALAVGSSGLGDSASLGGLANLAGASSLADSASLGDGSGSGGASSLADWESLINQSPDLQREVAIALPRLHRRPEEVACSGVRLGHNLDPLAGYRVTPVDCWFDGWVLRLEAENFARRDDGTTVPLARLLDRSERERSQFTGVSFKLKAWRWHPENRD